MRRCPRKIAALTVALLSSWSSRAGAAPPTIDPSAAIDRACGTSAPDLSKKALRSCAADRTNLASSLVERGSSSNDRALLYRAIGAYGLAARDWTRYLLLDEHAPDSVETRYWIADAWHQRVRLEAHLGGWPSPDEMTAARSAVRSAIAVTVSSRDRSARSTYLQPAAWRLVDLAQLAMDLQYRRYEETGGREGIEKRAALRTIGEGYATRAVQGPLPREVEEAIAARLAYIERVPRDLDEPNNIDLYTFQAADYYFLYGHFAEAKRHLRQLYPERCGGSEFGFKAWSRLRDIAALEGDLSTFEELANARSCRDKWSCGGLPSNASFYSDSFRLFRQAEKASPGPDRDRLWRAAAESYLRALERGPGRDEAPEAAMNGAYAWKQIGGYAEAMSMYQLFLREYGRDDILARLEKGEPHARPPRPPDPKKHKERLQYIKQAADALAAAHVLALDYGAAASMFDSIAGNHRFEPSVRAGAAQNAVILYAMVGERARATASRRVFTSLSPEMRELARVDWRPALHALFVWDERAPDTGANRAARLAAQVEVDRFLAAYEGKRGAEPLVVQAAHAAATLRRVGRDPQAAAWCRKAVRAFERFRADAGDIDGKNAALGSVEADLAAECALAEIEGAIRADLGAGPRRYSGDAAAIARAFAADRAKVERHASRLRDVRTTFQSKPSTVVARIREASLLDACVAGLDAAGVRAPGREEALAAVVRGYIEAVVWAEASRVSPPELIEARRRLAAIARVSGEALIRAASRGIGDIETGQPFAYHEGMFAAPIGLVAEDRVDLRPPPLPER